MKRPPIRTSTVWYAARPPALCRGSSARTWHRGDRRGGTLSPSTSHTTGDTLHCWVASHIAPECPIHAQDAPYTTRMDHISSIQPQDAPYTSSRDDIHAECAIYPLYSPRMPHTCPGCTYIPSLQPQNVPYSSIYPHLIQPQFHPCASIDHQDAPYSPIQPQDGMPSMPPYHPRMLYTTPYTPRMPHVPQYSSIYPQHAPYTLYTASASPTPPGCPTHPRIPHTHPIQPQQAPCDPIYPQTCHTVLYTLRMPHISLIQPQDAPYSFI